jgi:dTDP-4-dehydrorhamnose reductase
LIYGGRQPSKHETAAHDPSLTFYEDELRSPIELGDLVAALLELVGATTSGVLHVAGADGVSRCELARLIAGDVRCGLAPPDRPLDCRLDSSRAQRLLRTRLRGAREVLG